MPCEECGAPEPDGVEDCRRLFEEVIAKEFSDYRYAKHHRLTVDVYSLQHPERYMRSGKSFAAHLVGMFVALETEDSSENLQTLRRWLDGPKELERPDPPPPGQRGDLTIVHLHEAADPEEHLERTFEWARSVWQAWSGHHGLARKWLDQAAAA